VRALVTQAVYLPGTVVCDAFIRGLRPELANVCKRTEHGLVWDDLMGCIRHAVSKENTLGGPRPVHAASFAFSSFQGQKKKFGAAGGQNRNAPPFVVQERGSRDICHRCGGIGHWRQECPVSQRDLQEARARNNLPAVPPARAHRTDGRRGGGQAGRGGSGSRRGRG
jgi:hypothetical protein